MYFIRFIIQIVHSCCSIEVYYVSFVLSHKSVSDDLELDPVTRTDKVMASMLC